MSSPISVGIWPAVNERTTGDGLAVVIGSSFTLAGRAGKWLAIKCGREKAEESGGDAPPKSLLEESASCTKSVHRPSSVGIPPGVVRT